MNVVHHPMQLATRGAAQRIEGLRHSPRGLGAGGPDRAALVRIRLVLGEAEDARAEAEAQTFHGTRADGLVDADRDHAEIPTSELVGQRARVLAANGVHVGDCVGEGVAEGFFVAEERRGRAERPGHFRVRLRRHDDVHLKAELAEHGNEAARQRREAHHDHLAERGAVAEHVDAGLARHFGEVLQQIQRVDERMRDGQGLQWLAPQPLGKGTEHLGFLQFLRRCRRYQVPSLTAQSQREGLHLVAFRAAGAVSLQGAMLKEQLRAVLLGQCDEILLAVVSSGKERSSTGGSAGFAAGHAAH
mmetsp:Transcript_9807/g.36935  ORF Transcript_9807/g.36935 Transcript_9807/m.36935 type:complete len:302 (+) Transcript_9807:930-1835(+)